MSERTIRSRQGDIIGWIKQERGILVAVTRTGTRLATYDPKAGKTYDALGRELSWGDGLEKIITQHGQRLGQSGL